MEQSSFLTETKNILAPGGEWWEDTEHSSGRAGEVSSDYSWVDEFTDFGGSCPALRNRHRGPRRSGWPGRALRLPPARDVQIPRLAALAAALVDLLQGRD